MSGAAGGALGLHAVDGKQPVLIATRNAGKLDELRELFAALGYHALDLEQASVPSSPDEDRIECFATFTENAVAKARYYHRVSGGLATIADDSGLIVAALGGAPGVLSRRWAGATGCEEVVAAANNQRLISDLALASTRTARFVSVVAWVDAQQTLVEQGEVEGRIALAPRGSNGFGYDPLFEVAELGWRTFAEVSQAEKTAVSHRGRAFVRLARALGGGEGKPAG